MATNFTLEELQKFKILNIDISNYNEAQLKTLREMVQTVKDLNTEAAKTTGLYADASGNISLIIQGFNKTTKQIQENNESIEELSTKLQKISDETLVKIKVKEQEIKDLRDQGVAGFDEQITKRQEEIAQIKKTAAEQSDGDQKRLNQLKTQNIALAIQKKAQKEINDLGSSLANDITNSQIVKTFTLTGIYANLKEQISSIVVANQEFARTTGMIAGEMVNANSVAGLNAYGVSVADLTKNTGALVGSMVSFTSQTKTVQNDLSVAASKLELLNVSAAESGVTFNLLNKSLRVAGEDISKTTEMMARTAQGIGMAPAAMIKDFNAVMPQLAANGKKVFDVFYGLEKQAKSLGMAIGDLVSIAEGFDTFEGAAQKAALLNSILGDNYLNSLELVQANEQERIDLIKQGFELSGRQFSDMDRATQKSIAQSLGFKNAADAAAFFNTSTAEMRIEQMKTEASQAKLNEVMKDAAEIGKQISNIYNKIVITFGSFFTKIKDLVVGFAELNDKTNGALGAIAAVAVVAFTFGIALFGLAGFITSTIASIMSLGTAFATTSAISGPAITAIGTAVAAALTTIGTAAAAPPVAIGLVFATAALIGLGIALIGVGIAALGIGAGIMLAAIGFTILIASLASLGENFDKVVLTGLGFLFVFGLIVAGLLALSLIGGMSIPILKLIGIAVLLIGTGIFLAATGMAKFVDSIKSLADNKAEIKEAIDTLKDVSSIIGDMEKLNGVFVEMIKSLQTLTSNLQSFHTQLNSLTAEKTTTITANLKAVSDSIKLPEGNVTGFVESVNSVAGVLNAANNITQEKVNISRDFLKEVSTTSTKTVTNNNSRTSAGNIEVKVYLDSAEIASKMKITNKGLTGNVNDVITTGQQ